MTDFHDLGEHCTYPYCQIQDFLPIQCPLCKKTFCRDHCAAADHDCTVGNKRYDRRAVICPACQMTLVASAADDPNDVIFFHTETGKCKPDPSKFTPEGDVKKTPKCPVVGCRERLTEINQYYCERCRKTVCIKHRFDTAHECKIDAKSAPPGRHKKSDFFSSLKDTWRSWKKDKGPRSN